MKKNRAMRVAAMLLVLVMMTSCFVGGTFAKYTTSTTGTDSARVAYWGFKEEGTVTLDMFDGNYKNTADETTVNSATTDNVIAPGTEKEAEFGFAYTANDTIAAPEVDYSITVTATGKIDDAIKNNPNIKWYLDGKLATAEGETTGSWDALLTAIEALGQTTVEAGNLPTNFSQDQTHKVKWVWEFETADNADTDADEMAAQDKIDTEMGNKTTLDEVEITITITATQID